MDHRGRIVGMLGLPLTGALHGIGVAAVAHARAMRVRRREQPERRGGARGQPRGASKPRPLFAFSNNGRAEFWLGASRASGTSPRRLPGSGCVVVGLWGTHPSMAENGPSA